MQLRLHVTAKVIILLLYFLFNRYVSDSESPKSSYRSAPECSERENGN